MNSGISSLDQERVGRHEILHNESCVIYGTTFVRNKRIIDKYEIVDFILAHECSAIK